MKKLFSTTAAATAFCFILLSFSSCQKSTSSEETLTESVAVEMSEESSTAEENYADAEDLAQTTADEDGNACEAARGNGGRYNNPFASLRLRLGACATITVTPNDTTYPRTIRVDFGAGCVCADGRFRAGALVLHLTNPLRKPGATASLSFDNYSVNRVALKGTKQFINQSTASQYKISLTSNNCSVQFPNGRGYTTNSIKTITQVDGASTPLILRDDVFSTTVSSQTTYNNGTVITLNTDSALIKKNSCHWVNAGALKIKVNTREFKLNYGYPNNGDCDNKALLSWDNGTKTKEIKL